MSCRQKITVAIYWWKGLGWQSGGGDFYYYNLICQVSSMSSTTIKRTNLKSLSCLYQPPQEDSDSPLIASLHSQKMDLSPEDEEQLFQKTLAFFWKFFKSPGFHQKLTTALRPPLKPIQENVPNERALSFKKLGSRVCFSEVSSKDISKKELPREGRASRCNNKKISIFIMQEGNSQSSEEFFSDDFFSQASIRTIRSIEIPRLEMNLQTIQRIYQSPQPFLINLSLCLFVRYCIATKQPVAFEDSAWVLTVSTILAYKLYYDEEIEGLMECFMDVVGASRKDLIDLERCFLEAIDYNTVISNYHYHFVLSELLATEVVPK